MQKMLAAARPVQDDDWDLIFHGEVLLYHKHSEQN